MIKMDVEGIGIDRENNPLVLLRDHERKRIVPIWIGPAEAVSIQMELDSRHPPRPMTHDLINGILHDLGVELVKVTVNEFDRSVYYAKLHLRVGGNVDNIQVIDARPSDAIALALRAHCGIWVSEHVIEQTGIQIEAVIGEGNTDIRVEEMHFEGAETQPSEAEIDKFAKLLDGVDLTDEGRDPRN
jgi:bifunctional DNase/RNase